MNTNEILQKIINVSNAEINQINTGYITQYNLFHDVEYFHGHAGKEHYKILTYVSNLYKDETLYDVGTNKCMSAAALSSSMNNNVKSYDITQYLPVNPMLPRTKFILGDVREDKNLIKSPFIFFDVDHDGLFEHQFYKHLQDINYKGLLMCDDILLEGDMTEWWDSITEPKYDLSAKGHWSGTGLVHFT